MVEPIVNRFAPKDEEKAAATGAGKSVDHPQQQEVLDFDPSAASVFEGLKRARLRIGAMDLKIASIALVRRALLVSRNLRDFRRVPSLLVEDWTEPN